MLISTRNLIEFDNQFINFLVRFTGVYYVHFEITGGPGRRDLFTHRTIVCSKSHLFLVNEKAFLKRNNQSDFMACLKKPIKSQQNKKGNIESSTNQSFKVTN